MIFVTISSLAESKQVPYKHVVGFYKNFFISSISEMSSI